MLTKVKYFVFGMMTTVMILMGIFVWNTVSVHTETTYRYNPQGITNLFGSYTELTR